MNNQVTPTNTPRAAETTRLVSLSASRHPVLLAAHRSRYMCHRRDGEAPVPPARPLPRVLRVTGLRMEQVIVIVLQWSLHPRAAVLSRGAAGRSPSEHPPDQG
ncbi:hypothetical protein JYU34_009155 [Plutella xylostella]|uniref:Uncharacterized protein n=1 Tax=Plutella xylostella TaxID=51655 RepID=A0ABQ7QN95_PLUXY|nr:hypothetical protein JYU34_009155 [Plutella xylostella]